jgi:protein-S-isoprenylcysteine O-methyltransferase Ste14
MPIAGLRGQRSNNRRIDAARHRNHDAARLGRAIQLEEIKHGRCLSHKSGKKREAQWSLPVVYRLLTNLRYTSTMSMTKTNLPKPPRPRSAVSNGVGMAGLAGLCLWMIFALTFPSNPLRFAIADWFGQPEIAQGMKLSGPYAALMNVLFCGVPMVLWSVFVDKVHRNPTTGIDWESPPRAVRAMSDISITKLAGLWATWAGIAAIYCIFRFYWKGTYQFSMEMFGKSALPLFILSVPYVLWLDRRLKEPKDGAWHFGAMLMGERGWEREAVYIHLRAWAVKGFFLAFMIGIVPPGYRDVLNGDFAEIQRNPVALFNWLISLMFVLDVAFATVGYLLTMKPLDAHIRSATPYASGWAAALICYPPFVLMGENAPLDYHPGTADWSHWLGGHPTLLVINGVLMVGLTAIYAWATIAFGLRFSNLTDRGILTHGPYAFTKHPAYLSKNAFWWLATLPFLTTSGNWHDAVRNTAILAAVSGVYFWRAKTEEKHLSADPAYGDYAGWMARYGLITKWLTPANWGKRRSPVQAAVVPAE